MATPSATKREATLEDFLAIPESERFHELLGGELIEKASPAGEHGLAQASVAWLLKDGFGRGGSSSGGWWFASEVEVQLLERPRRIVRPDVAGWRRDRHAGPPRGVPVTARPDWVCEILSSTHRAHDFVAKKRAYHEAHVDHYWILDPVDGTLLVYRWHADGYLEVLAAQRGQSVRAEPFDAREISVASLFGDEPDEGG